MSHGFLGFCMKIIILLMTSVLVSLYGHYWYVMQKTVAVTEHKQPPKVAVETHQNPYSKIMETNQLIDTLALQHAVKQSAQNKQDVKTASTYPSQPLFSNPDLSKQSRPRAVFSRPKVHNKQAPNKRSHK